MFMMEFLDPFLCLGVVREMTSSSRSIARVHSLGHGSNHGRASHHIPSLVHLGDPIQEEARGDNSVEQLAKTEEPSTRDLVKEILACLPL